MIEEQKKQSIIDDLYTKYPVSPENKKIILEEVFKIKLNENVYIFLDDLAKYLNSLLNSERQLGLKQYLPTNSSNVIAFKNPNWRKRESVNDSVKDTYLNPHGYTLLDIFTPGDFVFLLESLNNRIKEEIINNVDSKIAVPKVISILDINILDIFNKGLLSPQTIKEYDTYKLVRTLFISNLVTTNSHIILHTATAIEADFAYLILIQELIAALENKYVVNSLQLASKQLSQLTPMNSKSRLSTAGTLYHAVSSIFGNPES